MISWLNNVTMRSSCLVGAFLNVQTEEVLLDCGSDLYLSPGSFLGYTVCGMQETRVWGMTSDLSSSAMWKKWFWAPAAFRVELCTLHDCGFVCLVASN
jgi:hypothetical protein